MIYIRYNRANYQHFQKGGTLILHQQFTPLPAMITTAENVCRFSLMGIYLDPHNTVAPELVMVSLHESQETLDVDFLFQEPDMMSFRWELSDGTILVGHKHGHAPGGLRFAIRLPESVTERQVHTGAENNCLHISIDKHPGNIYKI